MWIATRRGAAEPGAGTEATSRRAGGPAGARPPHTMAFLGLRRQSVSGTSSRARLATVGGDCPRTPRAGRLMVRLWRLDVILRWSIVQHSKD